MKVILDSNIVFSAILNPKSSIGDILLNSQDVFNFYTCEFLREEIRDHKEKILKLAGYTEQEFLEIEFLVYRHISFVSEKTIPFEFWQNAANYVREIDLNDISFVALSLFLDMKLWTGDKVLVSGLTQKGLSNVITTKEIQQIRLET